MKNIKYVKVLLICSLSILLLSMILNFIVNPNKVFPTNYFNVYNHHIGDRISKFYSCKYEKPKNLIIGTSRTGSINPKYLSKYVEGNVYNLSLGGSHIQEHYYYLKYFVENYEIKNVVYGLDFMSFFKIDENKLENALFDKNRFNQFYFDDYIYSLLGYQNILNSFETINDNLNVKSKKIDFDTGWVTHFDNYEDFQKYGVKIIDKRIKQKLKSYSLNTFSDFNISSKKYIDENLLYLRKIIALQDKYNFKLHLFINPTYYQHLDLIYKMKFNENYEYWQKAIVQLHPIYDFSGKNQITMKAENYMDASHYNSEIGKLIFARIFNDNSIKVPSDFGISVNKDNVDFVILKKKSNINKDFRITW